MIIRDSIFICTEPVECAIKLALDGGNEINGIDIYTQTSQMSFFNRLKLAIHIFWMLLKGKKS